MTVQSMGINVLTLIFDVHDVDEKESLLRIYQSFCCMEPNLSVMVGKYLYGDGKYSIRCQVTLTNSSVTK
jgi:hypothetical protein